MTTRDTCPLVTRRQFLSGLGATAAVSVAGYSVGIWGRNPAVAAAATGHLGSGADRTLVVVEMGGGNDGLSMVVPHAAGAYHDLRRDLAVTDPIDLDGSVGLHPNLGYVAERWSGGDLAVIEGIGYPDPDLSHFASMSTWWTGTPGGFGAGWLGRYLDATVGAENPLAGIAIGPGPSPALSGEESFVVSIRDDSGLRPTVPGWIDDADELVQMWSGFAASPVDSPALFGQVTAAIEQTVAASTSLSEVLGTPTAAAGQGGGRRAQRELATDMRLAAELAVSGIAPRVIMVHGFGDFDTHEGQQNRHGDLMTELDDGIRAFFEIVEAAGAQDRVVLATTSEFGRRAASNGSGTDHGTAAAHLVIGSAVRSGRYGESPDLTQLDRSGNLVHTVDYRSYYASVLDGWLEVGHEDILGGAHETFDLFASDADTPTTPTTSETFSIGKRLWKQVAGV
jgi:uncharacterized protein (DUF1501 family)